MSNKISEYFFILLALVGIGGAYTGFRTVYNSEQLVNGCVGGANLVLLLFVILTVRKSTLNRPVKIPGDLIFLPIMFLISLIMYWSARKFVNMLIYFF
jgi:drug/metabolite transporter superfamily protein YnfA